MADVIQVAPPFSQSVGYGVVVGLGGAFAIGMSFISLFMSKYFAEKQDSEMFMTAKHSVKTGLTASAVVSSWTIAATLLSSTSCSCLFLISRMLLNVCEMPSLPCYLLTILPSLDGYSYGVSGPFWVILHI